MSTFDPMRVPEFIAERRQATQNVGTQILFAVIVVAGLLGAAHAAECVPSGGPEAGEIRTDSQLGHAVKRDIT
jgi:hypothetical protein